MSLGQRAQRLYLTKWQSTKTKPQLFFILGHNGKCLWFISKCHKMHAECTFLLRIVSTQICAVLPETGVVLLSEKECTIHMSAVLVPSLQNIYATELERAARAALCECGYFFNILVQKSRTYLGILIFAVILMHWEVNVEDWGCSEGLRLNNITIWGWMLST